MKRAEPRKVHVRDASGKLLFTRLFDYGDGPLLFESGAGFVDRLQVERERWEIRDGWRPTTAYRRELEIRHRATVIRLLAMKPEVPGCDPGDRYPASTSEMISWLRETNPEAAERISAEWDRALHGDVSPTNNPAKE